MHTSLRSYLTNRWVLVNPYLLLRVLRGFVRALVLKKNTLRAMEIYPTCHCNLTCEMCSMAKFKQTRGVELDRQDYDQLAVQGAHLGAVSVTILGGEPLLYADLEATIATFKKRHFYIHMVSNATLVTRKRLERLKAHGLNGVCFSLDSMDRSVNDRIRGAAGHYDQVMAAIDWAREVGLYVNLAPVFFPGSIDDGVDVVKFCQTKGIGASGTQVAPVGSWEGGPTLSIAESDRVRSLRKKYPRLVFDNTFSYHLKQRCPAGKEKIAVSNYGEVFPCVINPISFGNIRTETIGTIMRRIQSVPEIGVDYPLCLAAENKHFIQRFLSPLSNFKAYPVDYHRHPASRGGIGH